MGFFRSFAALPHLPLSADPNIRERVCWKLRFQHLLETRFPRLPEMPANVQVRQSGLWRTDSLNVRSVVRPPPAITR